MARAHFFTFVLDDEGRPIQGATIEVREPGTETKIPQTLFENDVGDNTPKPNPFVGGTDGRAEFFLDAPKRVDIHVSKVGFDPVVFPADVFALDSTPTNFSDNGVAVTQRPEVSFDDGLVVTDDVIEQEIEISVDYGFTADMVDINITPASAGSSVRLARADHKHRLLPPLEGEVVDVADLEADGVSPRPSRADHGHKHGVGLAKGGHVMPNHADILLAGPDDHHARDHAASHAPAGPDPILVAHGDTTGRTANDHHPQTHVHDGVDGSGQVAHGATTGRTANDHHAQNHAARHHAGGADELSLQQLKGAIEFAHKTGQTVRNNTAVLADDPDIVVALEANAIYEVECLIMYGTSTGADFKYAFSIPAGATMRGGEMNLILAAGNHGDDRQERVSDFTAARSSGGLGGGGNEFVFVKALVVVGATAGNVRLRWAQNTAEATNTNVVAGTYLKATRVA